MFRLIFNKDFFVSITLILIGTFLFAFGINAFVIPNSFGEGGVTGVSLLLLYAFEINPAWSSFILNAILLVIGYRYLERKTMLYTAVAVITLSIFLDITKDFYVFIPQSPLVASITAGVSSGAGLGIVMLGNGSTAGSDIIAMMAKRYFGIPVSVTLLAIDILVMIPMSYLIGLERGIITLIMLFVTSRMLNFILEGFNPKKAIIIISKEYEQIGKEIYNLIGRGTTILHGTGFYSREERRVLYCVINRIQLMPLQRMIHEIDPTAFVTIADVNQVIGEGFTFYLDDKKNRKEK